MTNPLFYFFSILFFFTLGYGKIIHGAGLQVTTNGSGLYYKPIMPINAVSQFMGNAGLHFDNSQAKITFFNQENRNRKIYLDISPGYRRELMDGVLAGTFRPVFVALCGGLTNLKSISWERMQGIWKFKYAIGLGIQFYNGRLLNEFMLKYDWSVEIKGNTALQLAMYWK